MRGGLRSRRGGSHGGSTMSSLQMILKSIPKSTKVFNGRAEGKCALDFHLSWTQFVSFVLFAASAVSLAIGSDKFNVPRAPTKEEMSFSTYTARRKLNRLRRSACQLFTSEAMAKAIQRLELEVEARRLLVRKDRHLWRDIGKKY